MKRFLAIIPFLSFINADLIQPANYSALYHTYVQFEWEQIPTAERYQLMASRNDDFTDVVINATDSTLIYIARDNIEWSTQYYWRVRKHNFNGDLGTWSDVYTFTLAEQKSNVSTTISDETQLADGVTIFGSFLIITVRSLIETEMKSGIRELKIWSFIIPMMKVIYLVVI